MQLSRRTFFRLASAGPSLAGLRAADRPKRDMIVRSARPEDLEMPLDGFETWITPVERFFVRTHVYNPSIDAASWKLQVGGEVANAVTLDLAELKRMPRVELVSVLECAGNGRSFYNPTAIGLQWQWGAVGNGRWAGVRLADVLKRAGVKASAKEIAFNGGDQPLGTMPDFVRSVPLAKAMHPDTLLAYEMNGEPLPVSHGYPLRLVVPGWAGDSWVKWVANITVLDKELDSFWMKTAYRRPPRPVAPGTSVDPAQMVPVTNLRAKSVISFPLEGQKVSGAITVKGAAWAGEHPVAKVEFSGDGGRTWRPATLGREQAKYGWRLWQAAWTPPSPGSWVLMARATDQSGDAQPFVPEWNPSGYGWNVVPQVRVETGDTAAPAPVSQKRVVPEFPAKVKAACIGCHQGDVIAGQRLTRGQWERDIDKMVKWGAQVKPEDKSAFLDFLAEHFRP